MESVPVPPARRKYCHDGGSTAPSSSGVAGAVTGFGRRSQSRSSHPREVVGARRPKTIGKGLYAGERPRPRTQPPVALLPTSFRTCAPRTQPPVALLPCAAGGCVRGAQALKLVGKRATGGCVRGRGLSPAYKPLPIVLGLLAPTTSRGWDDRDCDRRPKPVTAPATPELEGAVDPPSWQYFRRAGGTGTLSIYRTKVAPPTPARAGPISLRTCRPVDRGSGVRVR